MNRIRSSKLTCLTIWTGLAIVLLASAPIPSRLIAHPTCLIRVIQSEDFKVGDQVSFKRGSQSYEGTITEIRHNGKVCNVEYFHPLHDRTLKTFVPTDQLALISRSQTVNSTELRKWTSLSGSFSLEATLESIDNDSLILKTADGKKMTIKLSQLSEADRKFAADAQKQFGETNPFKEMGSSIKRNRPKSRGPKLSFDNSHAEFDDIPGLERIEPDELSVKKLSSRSLGPWDFAGGFDKNLPTTELHEFYIKTGTTQKLRRIKLSQTNPARAFVVTEDRDGVISIHTIDLKIGEAISTAEIPVSRKDFHFSDISADGKMIATHFSKTFGTTRVDVWSIDKDQIKHMKGWALNQKALTHGDIAKFVGNRLVTADDQTIRVWDIEEEKLLFQRDVRSTRLCVAPDNKTLTYCTLKYVEALNTETGEVIGRVTFETPETVAFGRSGYSAVQSRRRLGLYETDGDKASSFSRVAGMLSSGARRPSPKAVLLDDRYMLTTNLRDVLVVDMERRLNLCRIVPAGNVSLEIDDDGNLWTYEQSGGELRFQNHQIDTDELSRNLPEDLDEIDVFGKGSAITVKADLSFSEEESNRILDSVQNQIEGTGASIEEGAEVVVLLETKKGKSRDINVRELGGFGGPFGRPRNPFGTTNATVQPTTSSVKVLYNDKIIWQESRTNTVGHMIHGQGDTIQEVIDNQCKPRPDFFTKLELPLLMKKHPAEGAFTILTMDIDGIQKVERQKLSRPQTDF